MSGEQMLTIVVGMVSIFTLLVILARMIIYGIIKDCPGRVFQTKKSYEKECREYEERRKKMNEDYPTLVSRLSHFFNLPEDIIKEEIRSICKEDSNDNSREV